MAEAPPPLSVLTDFKVTHPKLYDYNQDFEISIHGVAELECTACHGGKTGTRDLEAAHAGVLDPVRYDLQVLERLNRAMSDRKN